MASEYEFRRLELKSLECEVCHGHGECEGEYLALIELPPEAVSIDIWKCKECKGSGFIGDTIYTLEKKTK